jgi:hypothetical protein
MEVRKHAQQVTVAKKEKELSSGLREIQLRKAINNSELTQVDLSPRLIKAPKIKIT